MSFYKKIADFIVNDYKGCECSICNSIKNTGSNKCCEDENNCITGVVDCLKEMFGGSEYTYIPAIEIARYLNSESTDEQFAEVFALLYKMMTQGGRGISNAYDAKQVIKQMDVDALMQCLGRTLKEIQVREE